MELVYSRTDGKDLFVSRGNAQAGKRLLPGLYAQHGCKINR